MNFNSYVHIRGKGLALPFLLISLQFRLSSPLLRFFIPLSSEVTRAGDGLDSGSQTGNFCKMRFYN